MFSVFFISLQKEIKMSRGDFKSRATISLEQKETTRRVTIDIPNREVEDVTAGVLKNNHLRNLYSNFCIVNQEFLSYVISCNLSQAQYKLLIFLISEMDKENRIFINNQILMEKLSISEKTAIDAVKKLTQKKIIVRQKLGVGNYELQINYDILNPQFLFKNKATRENVKAHRGMIEHLTPYIKQKNTNGGIDLIDTDSGELFHTTHIAPPTIGDFHPNQTFFNFEEEQAYLNNSDED